MILTISIGYMQKMRMRANERFSFNINVDIFIYIVQLQIYFNCFFVNSFSIIIILFQNKSCLVRQVCDIDKL